MRIWRKKEHCWWSSLGFINQNCNCQRCSKLIINWRIWAWTNLRSMMISWNLVCHRCWTRTWTNLGLEGLPTTSCKLSAIGLSRDDVWVYLILLFPVLVYLMFSEIICNYLDVFLSLASLLRLMKEKMICCCYFVGLLELWYSGIVFHQ